MHIETDFVRYGSENRCEMASEKSLLTVHAVLLTIIRIDGDKNRKKSQIFAAQEQIENKDGAYCIPNLFIMNGWEPEIARTSYHLNNSWAL